MYFLFWAISVVGVLPASSCSPTQVVERQLQVPDSTAHRSSVGITPQAESTVRHLYAAVEGKEIPVCLFGTSSPDTTIIRRVGLPTIISSEPQRTTWNQRPCIVQDLFLGHGHNHPNSGMCIPSGRDKERFMQDSDSDIEMIVCQNGRDVKISIWTEKDFE
jgi:hypothetical protein